MMNSIMMIVCKCLSAYTITIVWGSRVMSRLGVMGEVDDGTVIQAQTALMSGVVWYIIIGGRAP